MRIIFVVFAIMICGLVLAKEDGFAYIDYRHDKFISEAEHGYSAISFILSRSIYQEGNNFGNLEKCDPNISYDRCVKLGNWILSKPEKLGDGYSYSIDKYTLTIGKSYSLQVMGEPIEVRRVDVRAGKESVNSFLFSADKGIVAIMYPYTLCEGIDETFYLLRGKYGIFAKKSGEVIDNKHPN